MKILHVISEAYETGGEERTLKLLHDKLNAADHSSIVLASDVNIKNRDPQESFANYTFPHMFARSPISRVTNQLFYRESYKRMREVLRIEQPDIVHLYTMEQVSPSILFLLKNYPVVATLAGPEFYFPPLLVWNIPPHLYKDPAVRTYKSMKPMGKLRYIFHRYLQGAVYRAGLKNVSTTLVHSHYMLGLAASRFQNITYFPEIVNPYPPAPLKSANSLLCIGRLEHFKGFQYVIAAMPALLKSFAGLKLHVVGDGPYRRTLEDQAATIGVQDSVIFHGWLGDTAVYKAYTSATVVVVPSIWPEAFGKVGPEAMSVGRPVVASDVGGVRDWLQDGDNGFLIKPADSGDIEEKLTILLSNEALLTRMGRRAVSVAGKFSADLYTERLTALYQDLVTKAPIGPGKEISSNSA